jgi:hypothetical protein
MENNRSLYDLLLVSIPSGIVGIISIMTLIISNSRQKKSHMFDVRMNKIEQLYSKLCLINGMIIGEKKKYEYDKNYFSDTNKISEILSEIEKLRIEAKLYFTLNIIESFRIYAEMFLYQMKKQDNFEKPNMDDGEYDEDDNTIIVIVPSTFEQRYKEYENMFSIFEDQILKISHKLLGYNNRIWHNKKRNKRSPRHPWLGLHPKKQKSTSA